MSNPLLSLEDLETYLDGEASCIDSQLDAAVGTVRAYCRWNVRTVGAETVVVAGSGTTVLQLPTGRLTAVEAVTIDGEELDLDTIVVSKATGTLRRTAGWPAGTDIEVEMTHGWADPLADVPEVIGIVAQLAQRIPAAVTAGGQVVEETLSDSAGTYRYRLADGASAGLSLSQLERMVLDAHRIGAEP